MDVITEAGKKVELRVVSEIISDHLVRIDVYVCSTEEDIKPNPITVTVYNPMRIDDFLEKILIPLHEILR
jgi:hypothetical protein